MNESLIIMDRYLLNDILEERDYIEWRDKIDELNKEYHRRVYYGTNMRKSICILEKRECIRCQWCRYPLWDFRIERSFVFANIRHNIFTDNCCEQICKIK